MRIRVTQQQGRDGINHPSVHAQGVDGVEVDQERQSPDLPRCREERQLVEDFSKIGDAEHGDHVHHRVWDGQEVGLEGVEAETVAEGEG